MKACSMVVVTGCALGWFATAGVAQEQAPDMKQFMEAMAAAMGGGQTNASGEAAPAATPTDFRKLKEFLPAELPGMTRTSATGERTAAMGMNVSNAEAVYEGDPTGRITLKITDMGSMGGFLAMAQAGMAMGEYDRETETGYERTLTWKGHKASESYDNKGRYGKFTAMIGSIVIDVDGSDVDFTAIEAARDAIALDDLLAAVKAGRDAQGGGAAAGGEATPAP